jgi:hypothetical protein
VLSHGGGGAPHVGRPAIGAQIMPAAGHAASPHTHTRALTALPSRL